MERHVEVKNAARSGRAGKKARDILKDYPKAKAERLMNLLRSKGMWCYDEDFPEDEEEGVPKHFWLVFHQGLLVDVATRKIQSDSVLRSDGLSLLGQNKLFQNSRSLHRP